MRIFKTHIENALESLGANRTRTFLTMLGVMIGIASITAIFSLSGGVSSLISSQVMSEGGAMIVVRPRDVSREEKNLLSQLSTTKNFVKSSLTEKDVEDISKLEKVVSHAPLATFSAEIKGEESPIRADILATTPSLESAISLKLRDGQFIAEPSNTQNIVIGQQLAINLFGTPDVIGRNLKIKDQSFLVIGVLEKQKSAINFSNVDFDNTAIVSFSHGKNLTSNNLQIQQINVKAESVNHLKNLSAQISSQISKNHAGEQDFEVMSGDEILHPSHQIFESAATVLALVAGISLVVGGIGIMNIMLVNVSERTREIGIRKALGANNQHILFQFLTESMIISLGGGVFGFAAGWAFTFGLSAVLPFKPAISWQIASLIGLISVGVGVIFGLYPAFRASRKDPIESLRHYN